MKTGGSMHTPGPWHFAAFTRNHEAAPDTTGVAVLAADGTIICDNEAYYPTELDPRNARLIAAAPDLLDALEAVRQCPIRRPDNGMCQSCAERVDAAIAKATGAA